MRRLALTDEVVELYARLAEVAPAERDQRLAALPADLRSDLEALLAAGESESARLLEQPFLSLDAELATDVSLPPEPPPQLGPKYTIVRRLGEGGHGDVYLAQQERPTARRVAVKVLRASGVDAAPVQRMRREARALAALDHPGIATVLDLGQTADGRPFLVTELVDGPPIDAWCSQRSLSFRARCELVAQVCDAVEHAHQRGIIHRDLKPGNILVAGEDRPQVKIVDFGTARILDPDSRDGPTLTCAGALLGTFGYMAPEQLRGEPADTRSDLFALGKLLAALLAEVAIPPHRRRDCAAIVRRATAETPRDRYQSAGAFAGDVRAMLSDGAVTARRHSVREAAARLVRRHPAPAALTLALTLTLAITGGLVAQQSAEAARARAAQKELLKNTLDSVVEILSRYIGAAAERAELARRLEAQIASMLAANPDDPELRVLLARVWTEQARIALAVGDTEAAVSAAQAAAETMLELVDPRTSGVEEVRELAHAVVIWGDMLAATGQRDSGRQRYAEALRLHEAARLRFGAHIGLLDDLCWSYDRASVVAAPEAGPTPENMAAARARLALAEHMLSMDPGRPLSHYNLAVAHIRIGQLLGDQQAQTLAHYDRARRLLAPIVADDPLRWSFLDDFARACYFSGRLLRRDGRLSEARDAHADGLAALLRAVAGGTGADERTLPAALQRALFAYAEASEQLGALSDARAAGELLEAIRTDAPDWRQRAGRLWLGIPAPAPEVP